MILNINLSLFRFGELRHFPNVIVIGNLEAYSRSNLFGLCFNVCFTLCFARSRLFQKVIIIISDNNNARGKTIFFLELVAQEGPGGNEPKGCKQGERSVLIERSRETILWLSPAAYDTDLHLHCATSQFFSWCKLTSVDPHQFKWALGLGPGILLVLPPNNDCDVCFNLSHLTRASLPEAHQPHLLMTYISDNITLIHIFWKVF